MLINDEQSTINGDGKQSRDFTYIENVIEAIFKACLAPDEARGEAFNVAYGRREYLLDIYYDLTKALDKNIEPHFGPDRPSVPEVAAACQLAEHEHKQVVPIRETPSLCFVEIPQDYSPELP